MGNIVLVAGGVGTAPVYPIARAFHELPGNHVITIFGARNKELIFWEDKMRAVSHECYVTTDNGSYGIKGFGTTALQQIIDAAGYKKDDESAPKQRQFDTCFAIGPLPMMRAVADVTRPYKIPTVVSLNTIMVDGTGMCGACRVAINNVDPTKAPKVMFACVDGPEFDGHLVDWGNLRQRMGAYCEQEKKEKEAPLDKPEFVLTAKDAPKIQTPMPVQDPKYRSQNWTEVALGYTAEMAKLEASRCLQCPRPMCVKGCPVQVPIPQFIRKIKDGDFLGAYKIIKTAHSCPSISGRVCPQEAQCQCSEGSYGCILARTGKEAVAIGRLERFVADYVRENNLEDEALINDSTERIHPIALTGKKVAVIGSGPAGIAAAACCAQAGHHVTMFEALHKSGGVLSYGIPEFRLPKAIVQQQIDNLGKLGLVDVKTNFVVGKSATIDDLKKEGYHAFFIGTGAGLPRFLGIPGEDLPGVLSANEFLTRCNLMKAYQFPYNTDTPVMKAKQVVVIGAGNVAMDCARCARRLGAEVVVVYRRRLQDSPARHEEVEHAQEEGINFATLNTPLEIVANCEQNGIKGLRTQINMFVDGEVKAIEGEINFHQCQMVIIAVGQGPNPIVPSTTPGLATQKGLITTDDVFATSLEGVYAGGDVNTGAATVIKALGAGKMAGLQINKYLEKVTDNLEQETVGKVYYPIVSDAYSKKYLDEAHFDKLFKQK